MRTLSNITSAECIYIYIYIVIYFIYLRFSRDISGKVSSVCVVSHLSQFQYRFRNGKFEKRLCTLLFFIARQSLRVLYGLLEFHSAVERGKVENQLRDSSKSANPQKGNGAPHGAKIFDPVKRAEQHPGEHQGITRSVTERRFKLILPFGRYINIIGRRIAHYHTHKCYVSTA